MTDNAAVNDATARYNAEAKLWSGDWDKDRDVYYIERSGEHVEDVGTEYHAAMRVLRERQQNAAMAAALRVSSEGDWMVVYADGSIAYGTKAECEMMRKDVNRLGRPLGNVQPAERIEAGRTSVPYKDTLGQYNWPKLPEPDTRTDMHQDGWGDNAYTEQQLISYAITVLNANTQPSGDSEGVLDEADYTTLRFAAAQLHESMPKVAEGLNRIADRIADRIATPAKVEVGAVNEAIRWKQHPNGGLIPLDAAPPTLSAVELEAGHDVEAAREELQALLAIADESGANMDTATVRTLVDEALQLLHIAQVTMPATTQPAMVTDWVDEKRDAWRAESRWLESLLTESKIAMHSTPFGKIVDRLAALAPGGGESCPDCGCKLAKTFGGLEEHKQNCPRFPL